MIAASIDRARRLSSGPAVVSAARLGPGSAHASTLDNLRLEIISGRDSFDALGPDWSRLYDRAGPAGQPFQSFAWSWHWANHFLEPAGTLRASRTTLHILVAWRGEDLVLVWPLVRVRNRGIVELRFLGDPVGEYGDALVDPGLPALPLLRTAWSFLIARSKADVVVLGNVREDAAIGPLMAENGAVTTRVEGAPYMDFTGAKDYEAYMSRFSGRSRSTRRRKRAKLAEAGPLTHRTLNSGSEARQAAREILELKRKWQLDKGIVSRSLCDPRTANFFADVADGLGHDTGCRIMTLDCAGKMVAAELTFVAKDRLVNHVLVYDVDHDRHSPGALLTDDSIQACFAGGIVRYDFMGPANGYKLDWSDAITTVTDYAVPMSLKGRFWVHAYLSYGRERLKRLVAALPASVRRGLASSLAVVLPGM
ncbi:MAG: GNAT family N-acetyltransferase [Hyphomicrobiaceae bacterium]|nr:GNAT family N-acetyltransferase [Hyphomicrobiaceae bacterium]